MLSPTLEDLVMHQLGMNLPELPSHYWHQNMFASFEEDAFGIRVRHDLGVENLLWATDYPHPDSTWPHSQEVIHEHFRDVPVEEMRLIVGGNMFRQPLDEIVHRFDLFSLRGAILLGPAVDLAHKVATQFAVFGETDRLVVDVM